MSTEKDELFWEGSVVSFLKARNEVLPSASRKKNTFPAKRGLQLENELAKHHIYLSTCFIYLDALTACAALSTTANQCKNGSRMNCRKKCMCFFYTVVGANCKHCALSAKLASVRLPSIKSRLH